MKILLVATVAKEHVNKFYIPKIQMLMNQGDMAVVACQMDDIVQYNKTFDLPISRLPFKTHWFSAYRMLKNN